MSLIALVLSSSFANDACRFQGPYVGIQAGGAFHSGEKNHKGKKHNKKHKGHKKNKGAFLFGVFGGYTHAFANKILAGANLEINGMKHSGGKTHLNVVPALRLGYALSNDFAAFLKAGVNVMRTSKCYHDSSKTHATALIGVDADYMFNKNIFVRLGYDYSFKKKNKLPGLHAIKLGVGYKF